MRHVVVLKSEAKHGGGLEKYAHRVAEGFRQTGAKVTLLTGDGLPKRPTVIRLEQFDRFVQKWLEKHPADLVFGMDRNREQTHLRAGNGVHASYLKSRLFTEGKLKVLLCHINPLHRKILEIERAGFENPKLKKIFVNSQMVEREILEHYNVDPKKIQVIHNGVEWQEMEKDFLVSREEALETLGLQKDLIHLLFIGNGYLRKGLDRLLEAIALMKHEPFHLSVVGKDRQIDRYRKMALQLKLTDRVTFFGPVSNVRPFYQMADSLVIPSFYDPFANVTVEGLAMGLFVVSSKYNGGKEVLTEENGSIIEDLLSPDAIRLALKGALKRKTETRALQIRRSVQHLDFSNQMDLLIKSSYE